MSERNLRRGIVDTARAMNSGGINQGTSGNVSARTEGGFLITPSGIGYDDCTPADVVPMAMDGTAEGGCKPSSEWPLHRDVLAARSSVNAVLHAHPPFATALACLGRGIPAFHYMVAIAGGRDIRCAPYATFGSADLSQGALAALEGRTACLLANHGMVAVGRSLKAVLMLAIEVETLAQQYMIALQAGEPNLLDDAEMDVVLEKFKAYKTDIGGRDGRERSAKDHNES